jgi:hypothetical protein
VLRKDFENGEPLTVMGDHLREYYTGAETYRANLIARTEATASMNEGDLEAVEQMGLGDAVGKVWLSEPDDRTRPTHAEAGERYANGYDAKDGSPMTIEREFEVGEDRMLHPAGGSIAGENCNCRCGMVYEVLGEQSGKKADGPGRPFFDGKGGPGSGNFGHGGRPGQVGGSSEGGGSASGVHPDKGDGVNHPALNKSVVNDARQAVMFLSKDNTAGIEYGVLIGKGGKPLGSLKGNKDTLPIPKAVINDIEYLAHNHPINSSFSGEDVSLLVNYKNVQQIDAMVGNGETVYSLYKPEGWERPTSSSPKAVWTLHQDILNAKKYQTEYNKAKTDDDLYKVWAEHSHELMKVVADMYNLKYVKKVGGTRVKSKQVLADFPNIENTDDVYILDDSAAVNPPFDKFRKGEKNE